MDECYHDARGGDDFPELDEWLCEYVDGTLDPVVRGALEEYMQANPDLAAHVARLTETRRLLGRYGCARKAPCSLQYSLRRRLASERYPEASRGLLNRVNTGLGMMATCASVVAILMLLSVMANSGYDKVFLRDTLSLTAVDTEPPASSPLRLPATEARPVHFATPANGIANSRFYQRFIQLKKRPLQYSHLAPILHLPASPQPIALPLRDWEPASLITSP